MPGEIIQIRIGTGIMNINRKRAGREQGADRQWCVDAPAGDGAINSEALLVRNGRRHDDPASADNFRKRQAFRRDIALQPGIDLLEQNGGGGRSQRGNSLPHSARRFIRRKRS